METELCKAGNAVILSGVFIWNVFEGWNISQSSLSFPEVWGTSRGWKASFNARGEKEAKRKGRLQTSVVPSFFNCSKYRQRFLLQFNSFQVIKMRPLAVKEWIKWITSKSSGGIMSPRWNLSILHGLHLVSFSSSTNTIPDCHFWKVWVEVVWVFLGFFLFL